jgi:hypothetical protein
VTGDQGRGADRQGWRLDPEALAVLADQRRDAYRNAEPFPHVVIDDFLPEQVLDTVLAEFPAPAHEAWHRFDDPVQAKLGNRRVETMGPASRQLLHELNSGAMCAFVERLAGIDGIVPDPHLHGGGLHQIVRGGYLKVHADYNWHPRLRLHRRVNLLLYLNRDWREDYGGHLELWDTRMRRCVRRVLPIFNRCVVFSTTSVSHHGHPEPLRCPEGRSRKSVALYYYSRRRPAWEIRAPHSTLFRPRPREMWRGSGTVLARGRILAAKIVPPFVARSLRGLALRVARSGGPRRG